MTPEQLGGAIGAGIGGVWGLAGAAGLARPWRLGVGAVSLAITAALVGAILTHHAVGHGGRFDGAVYGIAVGLESAAIMAGAIFLNRTHRPTLAPPFAAAVVGLHFVGLWRATGTVTFVYLAAALVMVGIASAVQPPPRRLACAGLGSAVALWAAAATTLA